MITKVDMYISIETKEVSRGPGLAWVFLGVSSASGGACPCPALSAMFSRSPELRKDALIGWRTKIGRLPNWIAPQGRECREKNRLSGHTFSHTHRDPVLAAVAGRLQAEPSAPFLHAVEVLVASHTHPTLPTHAELDYPACLRNSRTYSSSLDLMYVLRSNLQ